LAPEEHSAVLRAFERLAVPDSPFHREAPERALSGVLRGNA
jgi:hypothetical protein